MITALADYWRLMRAGVTLARHDVILPAEYAKRLPLPAKAFGSLLRSMSGKTEGRPGERLADALESLGPAYIKLGQFLATRPDVFGVETTTDLSRLKDKLPPFPDEKARQQLEEEFGKEEAAKLFPDVGTAIAAASLAQVHRMETSDGMRAVKILRPGVDHAIMRELRAMKRAARTIETVDPNSRRMEPVAFVETVATSMEKELDLRLEAGGASEFAEIAAKTGTFAVPKVDWDRSGKTVLTTDWVNGTPLTDTEGLAKLDFDRPEMANNVTQGFLQAAIQHGVFHADMHEGNMILGDDGKLYLIDFGIVGRIGLTERRFLAEILDGFIRRDYKRVAEVHFEAGYVPADRSVGDFAQALRSVGEPIHGKPAEEVSMGRLLLQLLDFTHTFGMHLRPELVLLQKTMVQVEGVARSLDPNHNIWDAAKPVVQNWIRSEFGPAGMAKHSGQAIRSLAQRALQLPEVMDRVDAILAAQEQQAKNHQGMRLPGYIKRPVSSLAILSVTIIGSVLIGLGLFDAFFS
ncbi:AarF/UbiB family protein [Ponticaulis sp.]|uniref:AarF/UbiB family protein n=1 Tax=Ponticaulis sp. TaxID=2020902 RepID=UPI000B744D89|nr:AarF/UbiB family protein [Ponticaulis sp.]MAI91613.1 ubiquinone biosynthesis protein UbiB [Ponticaulis sp.]OUX97182.1 MAG: ubiquinone biosynthesis protein UbiB [Hyphomonadaceae bacterium TMED5]|tara:strand:+ start:3476 stop:5035 length:1560 start_codon:yes stop_codon:yes gene_type:complete